jgi:glycosyltransferase involved in cell wall biosynthesis
VTPDDAEAIAVVIPAFNCGAYIEVAVRSALEQTLPPAEIVMVDDGSTDDTVPRAQLIDGSETRLQVVQQANAGVSSARNAGIRATTSPLVAFLDGDDLWYADKLRQQERYLREHAECVVVGARMDYYGEHGRIRGAIGEPTPASRQGDIQRATYMPVQLSSWLVRRSALDLAGEFDLELRQAQDVDMLARLARVGQVHILPGPPQGGYRLHRASATSARFHGSRRAVRFVRARLAARDTGGDLTLEEFSSSNPEREPSRSDRAKHAFRESGVAFAHGRHGLAAFRIARALALDPAYALRRVRLRLSSARR